jgi:2-aminoadipate transaminase
MDHLLAARARTHRASAIRELLLLTERPGMRSLAGGLPGGDRLPVDLLRDAAADALTHLGPTGPIALQYAPTEGVAALKEHLATMTGHAPAEVLVTTGSQQALDLIARVLCDPGDVVVVEEPGYLGALQAFRFGGATLHGVPGDADGLDVDRLAEDLAGGLRPKAVVVTPDFANPTGATLAAERRTALVVLAERYGFLVVEDDPYGRLRFAGRAAPPMGAPGRPVVRLGSASKILAPGLRVGWLTGPAPIVAALARAKQATDLHTSAFDQLVVLGALIDPRFPAHLEATVAAYRTRACTLVGALRHHFGDAVDLAEPDGGMFLWVRLPGIDTVEALGRSLDAGVAYVPGTAFAVAPGAHRDRARLSFATLPRSALEEACVRLAGALSGLPSRAWRDG